MVFIDLIMMFELVGVWFLGELVFFSFGVLNLFEVLIFGQDFVCSITGVSFFLLPFFFFLVGGWFCDLFLG